MYASSSTKCENVDQSFGSMRVYIIQYSEICLQNLVTVLP